MFSFIHLRCMENLDIYILQNIGEDGVSAAYIQKLLVQNPEAKKVNLYIDSQGGSVFEGYSIYNQLKNSGKSIDAHVIGFCGSIATMIALAADNIYMNEHGRFFIHNPSTQVQGDIHAINAAADELDKIKNELVSLYYSKTGKDKELISDLMDKEKNFTAQEAKEFGFITSIKEPSKAVALVESKSNILNMDKKELDLTVENKVNSLGEKILAKIQNLISPENAPEGEKIILTTAEGVEFDIWVDAIEGEDLAGRKVMKIVAGEVSEEPIEDGEYALADGSMIVVAEGMVESISTPEAEEDVEALKKELEEAKAAANAANEALENFKAEAEKKEEENKAELKALAESVNEMKNLTVGAKDSFLNVASKKQTDKSDKFFK